MLYTNTGTRQIHVHHKQMFANCANTVIIYIFLKSNVLLNYAGSFEGANSEYRTEVIHHEDLNEGNIKAKKQPLCFVAQGCPGWAEL